MKKLFTILWNNNVIITKVFLFLLSTVLLVSFFPREGVFKYDFQHGKPWKHDDLIAPFSFAILKTDKEISDEKKLFVKELKPYYAYNASVFEASKNDFVQNFYSKWGQQFTDTIVDDELKKKHLSVCLWIIKTIYKKGVVYVNEEDEHGSDDCQIILIKDNMAEEVSLSDLYTISKADYYIKNVLKGKEELDASFLIPLLQNAIDYNIVPDKEKTENEREAVIEKISLAKGMVQAGEKIISMGDLVTGEKDIVLQSYKREYESQLGSKSRYYLILLGQIMLVCISIIVLMLFLYSFKKDIYDDNKKLLLIMLLIYLMVFAISTIMKYNVKYIYVVPLCVIPMIIRAFFDTRTALFVHIVTIIIIGFLVPNGFGFVFLQLIAGIITIISIVKLQRRSQFFLSSILIFLTYSVIYSGLSLMQDGSFSNIDSVNYAWFAGSALLTLFSYPIIYLFEKVFGFVTDVSLMELSDTNSKLLRELSLKAPGTFQHSLHVANLAEEVIYQIGGNALLARTGALYHDIGKMEMPFYYIENQTTEINPHDEIEPDESAVIITNHVINGVEKAKKNNIPEQVIDFIRTHHGTTKAQYFYNAYKEVYPNKEIDDDIFTYHGPIPYSKETAVLMMTDTVEAASRSLKNPDEEAISNLVNNVINKHIDAGQFVNADITMKNISTVKKILTKQLLSFYHIRIEY